MKSLICLVFVLGSYVTIISGCNSDYPIEFDIMPMNDTILICDTIINKDSINYNGLCIDEHIDFSYDAQIIASIPGLGSCQGRSFQGMSVYNNYVFCFYDTGICRCVDLYNKNIISEFFLPEEAHHKKNHAGVACFSEEFLNEEDDFPLLYLTSYQEYKCYVLRMFKDKAELIQVLYTTDNLYSQNNENLAPVVGYEPDKNKLLLKVLKSSSPYIYKWIVVERPKVNTGETYYINLKNTIDCFQIYSSAAYNAGFAYNGRIYQLAGYKQNDRKIYVIDYVKKILLVDELWNNQIINDREQEQCAKYKEGILINYNGANKLVYVRFNNWFF